MELHNARKKHVNPDSIYDFYKERFFTNIFGFYIILKKPYILYLIHKCFFVCAAFLYIFGVSSGIYTMVFIAKNKSEQVNAFYGMGLMGVAIGLQLTKNATNDSLNSALDHIREGVYQYNEVFQDEIVKLKLKRIERIKFIITFVGNGNYFCWFSSTLIPLIQVILSGFESIKDEDLNPFLPVHLYVPFDTTNTMGYAIAFVSYAFIIFTMYATFASHAQIYISCSLQLAMELEVLNFALKNMQKRAYLRFKKEDYKLDHPSTSNLYENPDFQHCINLCLRENLLHHHAILRYRDTVTPYVQTTVAFVLFFFSCLMAAGILMILENSRPQFTLLTDIFGFFPLCWVGQEVMNESGETKNALFDTPWPDFNEDTKALLKTFMTNVQKPIILRARALDIKLCLETFGDMVTLGYKITNLMR
uniref:Odorant receptor n=1 Tax=Yemma signatus TaxID=300820 RepID=A0A385H508_9HEMI|nr:odorant receptor [Yemma signatus]